MTLYTFEEILDEDLGPIGTPERDAFEAEVKADVEAENRAFELGETIREARRAQHLTQEQLGDKVGMRRDQIARLETGRSVSFVAITRVFRALGFPTGALDLGPAGKVALW